MEPEYHLVDMVVTQVDATVVTLSALVAETRLVLLETGGPELARAGYLSQGLLNQVLKTIVHRELLLREVRQLKLPAVADREVEESIDRVKSAFSNRAEYERFLDSAGFREPGAEMMRGFDAPPKLVATLRAQIQVDRFLEPRVRRGVTVRDADIAACYEANRALFAGRPLATVRPQIQDAIVRQEQDRAYRTLIEQLMKRAVIRYADKFEPLPDAADALGGLVCPERRAAVSRDEAER